MMAYYKLLIFYVMFIVVLMGEVSVSLEYYVTSVKSVLVNITCRNMFLRIKNLFPKKINKYLTIQDTFKPLYILLSIAGLFPHSIKFHQTKQEYVIIRKSLYINLLCAGLIILIFSAFSVIHIEYVFISSEGSPMTEALITDPNYAVELALISLSCAVIYVYAYIYRFKYVKILNDIIHSWCELRGSDADIILQKIRHQVNIFAVGGVFVTLIVQICVNFTRAGTIWKKFLVCFSLNLPLTIQFISIVFYYILIIMTTGILSNIKDHCIKYSKYERSRTEAFRRTQKTLMTIRQLEIMYVKAIEIKREINIAFQAPILVMTLQCFHAMVSEAHIIFHGVVIEQIFTVHQIVNCGLWVLYQIIKICALSHSGTVLKREAKKIGQVLHNIPTENQDLRFLMEVQHFSELMSYQSADTTIYGFFSLDATLTFKILASATMYLIILVQFDKKS